MGVLSREDNSTVVRSTQDYSRQKDVEGPWRNRYHQRHNNDAIVESCDEDDDDNATMVLTFDDTAAKVSQKRQEDEEEALLRRLRESVTENESLASHIVSFLSLRDMSVTGTAGRDFLNSLRRVNSVRVTSRSLCMPSLIGRFRGAKCLTIQGGIDLFNIMGLLAWPLQTSMNQVCQINFEIDGDEIGDDARGFQHWERGLTTLARSGALRSIEYMKFEFKGRLKGVARYLTHATFEGLLLTEKPSRLISRECALVIAASHPEIACSVTQGLLRRGADPNATAPGWNCSEERGSSALLLAAQANNREVVRSLLEAGADSNFRAPGTGKSALHCAVANDYFYSFAENDRPSENDSYFGSTRIIAYSTPLPHPPRTSDKRRRPPLARFERASIVDTLLKAGADVNAVDSLGNTPLIAALAGRGDLDWDAQAVIKTARALLDAGADVLVKNHAGHTALTVAVDLDKPIEVLGILAEAEVAADASKISTRRHASLSSSIPTILRSRRTSSSDSGKRHRISR